eukprot:CAMPEP_0205807200 /NCGR_PEP_ID=MMETSP0205-20121125/10908_1 /ASSEMBLY_ACC=CAM_ASM_000278 /TAXON_ID=36767 /ORGANISM="Euplotes focardii, Strain TN1" /LENGTH=121 /DNA_ID=CAMNT_0053081149 /DNA_START=667 /DNA_END=1033 /DNA_ORIENTATION=+
MKLRHLVSNDEGGFSKILNIKQLEHEEIKEELEHSSSKRRSDEEAKEVKEKKEEEIKSGNIFNFEDIDLFKVQKSRSSSDLDNGTPEFFHKSFLGHHNPLIEKHKENTLDMSLIQENSVLK